MNFILAPIKAAYNWGRAHPLLAVVAFVGVVALSEAIIAWSLHAIQRFLGAAAFTFVGRHPILLSLPFYLFPPLWPIGWVYTISIAAVYLKHRNE